MVDKAHSLLTGGDLHDLKGVSSATDGQVPVAASGASVWGKLTATSLTGTGNPFGGQLLHVREEQSSGVDTTNANTAGAWVTRVLNTVKTNEISGASLASNQLTLPAGTYFIKAQGYGNISNFGATTGFSSRLKVFNVTDNTDLLLGMSFRAVSTVSSGTSAGGLWPMKPEVEGRFTLTGTKAVDIRHYFPSGSSAGQTNMGIGTEVYTDVLIWKVA